MVEWGTHPCGIMVIMPMNRHLTWGDRQAEVAREKNLQKLKKLAAMAPVPASVPEASATPASPSAAKSMAAKPKTAMPATTKKKSSTAEKTTKSPAKKSTKK